MVEISSPALEWDLAELAGRVSPVIWGLFRLQARIGRSWAMHDEDGTIAACGIVDLGLDPPTVELWLVLGPRARRHLLRIIREARLTVFPEIDARIVVKVRTQAGRRLAEALGFAPVSDDILMCERGSWVD